MLKKKLNEAIIFAKSICDRLKFPLNIEILTGVNGVLEFDKLIQINECVIPNLKNVEYSDYRKKMRWESAFVVGYLKEIPATREEPSDSDFIEICTTTNLNIAIIKAINATFAIKIDDIIEDLADSESIRN